MRLEDLISWGLKKIRVVLASHSMNDEYRAHISKHAKKKNFEKHKVTVWEGQDKIFNRITRLQDSEKGPISM